MAVIVTDAAGAAEVVLVADVAVVAEVAVVEVEVAGAAVLVALALLALLWLELPHAAINTTIAGTIKIENGFRKTSPLLDVGYCRRVLGTDHAHYPRASANPTPSGGTVS